MIRYDSSDTIAAIATPMGESGIGIVRISGKEALLIADKIFLSKDGKKPSSFKTYTVHYGWIIESSSRLNPSSSTKEYEVVDEVILTVMRAPKSYTKEDVVEINCHGGIVALRRVLELVLDNGARLAEPGEFTKRAFLNGRIDLTQAEAVLDIIKAKTDYALKIGIQQLRGGLSLRINKLRDSLIDILCLLEANIDFPEEEIGRIDLDDITKMLQAVTRQLKYLLENAKQGRILREGIKVVICGRPNVGKSSLLNALLKQERSIVTPIAGTTRDTIEEIFDIKGIPIRIVDTAGIIEPKDLIERKAIQRTRNQIASADLVILLFDGSQRLTEYDELLIKRLKQKMTLAVINKIDLKQRIERLRIKKIFKQLIEISAKKFINIDLLEEAIVNLVYSGKVQSLESVLMSNLRHIRIIKGVERLITRALNSLKDNLSLEFIAQDIKDALLYLDEILGKSFNEDLLERIFSEFCIGK
ncbi:MAG: tRNA uridine-5-carboxymethylaminomethyl(34) synthesis GTPase MnmE [Candidatus Omnitrophica bacterium]|nr:tRNA uridine-5-carboxymethylaminomethyl(34) synthesis GTPase MnmE [Candidatus Omnitrophota bacterium]